MTDYELIETLDWLWSDGYVDEIIDKLGQLLEKHSDDYKDIMLDQMEYATPRGLIQEVKVLGIPIDNAIA